MPNVIVDPSFEAGVANVNASTASTTVTQITTDAWSGSACASWVRSSGSGNMTLTVPLAFYAASPGQVWSAGAWVKLAAGTARQVRCDIRFFNSGGTDIGGLNGSSPPTPGATFVQSKVEGTTAPALTASVSVRLVALSTASGNGFRVDGLQLEQGATLPTYNEGSVPPTTGSGAGTFAFAGTASGSTVRRGTGSGTVAHSGAATGKRTPKATGGGTLAFVGTAIGRRTPKGAGSGAVAYTGSAGGSSPSIEMNDGTGAGSWAFAGTGAGKRAPKAAGSGVVSFAGSAVGSHSPKASASGSTTWTGQSTGTTQRSGSSSGAWTFVGVGSGVQPGPSTDFEGRILSARLAVLTATGAPHIPATTGALAIANVTGELDTAQATGQPSILQATGALA